MPDFLASPPHPQPTTSTTTRPASSLPSDAATGEHSSLRPDVARALKRDAAGLVAAVVQEHATRDVLMVGWMDDEAVHRTLTEGRVTFYSRSRQEYWRKGDTSGHAQYVRSVHLDCDGDALLVVVDQVGAACHTGARSCFFTDLDATPGDVRAGANAPVHPPTDPTPRAKEPR